MRGKKLVFVLVLGTALIFLAGGIWWQQSLLPANEQKDSPGKIFVVKKGESLTSIAGRLKQEGLIKDAFAFRLLVLVKDLSATIQAGDFRLSPAARPEEIISLLSHGALDIWLTFPEGWRREEISQRLTNNLPDFDSQLFLDLSQNLEGHLFPDTYLIPKEASPAAVLRIFENNFEKRFTDKLANQAQDKGLTKEQVLVLASIVEREARTDQDRPIVAGILIKRWRNDWPLQADATIQYAIATQQYSNIAIGQSGNFNWWPKNLTKTDLEINSPYNTYKNKGLPPSPICNPGLASIEAVINYRETPYWFYLSDAKGQIHYAKTVDEHNQNIARYLKI